MLWCHAYLTESSKSPASIAQSNKQWVGTCLYQEWHKPLLISCEAAIRLWHIIRRGPLAGRFLVILQVAKRIANICLTWITAFSSSPLSYWLSVWSGNVVAYVYFLQFLFLFFMFLCYFYYIFTIYSFFIHISFTYTCYSKITFKGVIPVISKIWL